MNFCGYGVLIEGKPKGIWPVPLDYAKRALATYRAMPEHRDKAIDIVAVYCAETPVTTVRPSSVFAGASNKK